MTPAQCIQYALDKPGVLTVLPGPGSVEEWKTILSFVDASPEERDYSLVSQLVPDTSKGTVSTASTAIPVPPVWILA